MRLLKQNTATNLMLFMSDSLDHASGKAGLTLSITLSKDGAAFAAIAPVVTERGNGWYNIALTDAMVDTLGDIAFHITATGADSSDFLCRVVPGSLDADISTRLSGSAYTEPDNAGIQSAVSGISALDAKLDIITTMVSNIESYDDTALMAIVTAIKKVTLNKVVPGSNGVITIYEDNGVTVWKQFNLTEGGRVEV